MDVTYGIIKEIYTLGEESRTAYGIAAYSDAEKNGTACILSSARDLSQQPEPLSALVAHLNREHASLLHFQELVCDFMAEN